MSNDKISREDRNQTSRDAEERQESWKPGRILPDPIRKEGMDYRWVRASMRGRDDNANINRALRNGWEFIRRTDELEKQMNIICDFKSPFPEYVVCSGMVLMHRPRELSLKIKSIIREKTDRQIEAVDNDMMKVQDTRVPMFSERRTTVTKGRG